MSVFGAYLEELWRERGLNQARFAAALGENDGYISQIRRGIHKLPPMEKMPAWAEACGLQPGSSAYTRFLRLAAIAHLPDVAQEDFIDLIDAVDRQAATINQLERRVAEMEQGYRAE